MVAGVSQHAPRPLQPMLNRPGLGALSAIWSVGDHPSVHSCARRCRSGTGCTEAPTSRSVRLTLVVGERASRRPAAPRRRNADADQQPAGNSRPDPCQVGRPGAIADRGGGRASRSRRPATRPPALSTPPPAAATEATGRQRRQRRSPSQTRGRRRTGDPSPPRRPSGSRGGRPPRQRRRQTRSARFSPPTSIAPRLSRQARLELASVHAASAWSPCPRARVTCRTI